MTGVKKVVVLILALLLVGGYFGVRSMKQSAQAYIFGYPLVLMELTQAEMASTQTVNHFTHNQNFPDHTFRDVVRPNNDTLYSIAWLDLSDGPLVLNVPDTDGRYYVIPLMDAWTNVFATVGKRSYGTERGSFLIVGPDWPDEPTGELEVLRAPTNMVWIIGRIQTNGIDDIPQVAALQKQFTLSPLQTEQAGKVVAPDDRPGSATGVDPYQQIDEMSGAEFFALLSRSIVEQPPAPEDAQFVDQLEEAGLLSGQYGWLQGMILNKAKDLARAGLQEQIEAGDSLENGWAVRRDTIGTYGTNYGVRAAVAMVGLGALPPAEAAYPNTEVDAKGRELSGAHQYRLHFPAGETPPANAFWSLTMYDQDGFLVDNPIGRYTIGDRDTLVYNEDGSLDLLVQHGQPSNPKANWLPAPKGSFALTMRIYFPKVEFLDGSWSIPEVERLD